MTRDIEQKLYASVIAPLRGMELHGAPIPLNDKISAVVDLHIERDPNQPDRRFQYDREEWERNARRIVQVEITHHYESIERYTHAAISKHALELFQPRPPNVPDLQSRIKRLNKVLERLLTTELTLDVKYRPYELVRTEKRLTNNIEGRGYQEQLDVVPGDIVPGRYSPVYAVPDIEISFEHGEED